MNRITRVTRLTRIKKPELEWTLITLTAAALTALLVVSCAPTHRSYPLSSLNAPANPVAPTVNDGPAPQPSLSRAGSAGATALAGSWICEQASQCAIMAISIRADGSALADGQQASLSIAQNPAGSAAAGADMIHLSLSVPAHGDSAATTLSGDVSATGTIDEITLNGAVYARASD